MTVRIAGTWAAPLGLALGLALTLSSCRSPDTGRAPAAPEASAPALPEAAARPPAPAFAAETVDGKKLALADYRGRSAVLLLGFAVTTAPAGAEKGKEAKCPVSAKVVTIDDKTPKVLVNGQPSYFCCPNCPKAFAKTPEKFVKDAGKCPVMRTPAKADASARTVVNNNLYYVCCPGCDVTASPEKTLKTLVDPVTKKEFKVTSTSPRSDYQEQIYFFSAAECKAAFDKEPAKYAVVFGK